MSLLNIIFIADGVEIGVAHFIEIKNETRFRTKITIKDVELKESIIVPSQAEIKILFDGQEYTAFDFEIEDYKNESTQLILYTGFNPPEYLYDQSTVNVFHLLDESPDLDWRLLSEMNREGWLRMCLFQNGLPDKIQSGALIVDCSEIQYRSDFFCLLGEIIVGEKGYFGQDLDGLADCLIESYPGFVNDGERKIVFQNLEKLGKVFSEDDVAFIVNKFEQYGFQVAIQ